MLEGVHRGLQASYLNQPIQVAALRPKLQQLTGRPGDAQLLPRLGSPTKALPAAPRRPVSDVIVTAQVGAAPVQGPAARASRLATAACTSAS